MVRPEELLKIIRVLEGVGLIYEPITRLVGKALVRPAHLIGSVPSMENQTPRIHTHLLADQRRERNSAAATAAADKRTSSRHASGNVRGARGALSPWYCVLLGDGVQPARPRQLAASRPTPPSSAERRANEDI